MASGTVCQCQRFSLDVFFVPHFVVSIEEMAAREQFISDHGGFLPGDLCPFVPDLPAKWAIECDGDEGAVSLTASVVMEVSFFLLYRSVKFTCYPHRRRRTLAS